MTNTITNRHGDTAPKIELVHDRRTVRMAVSGAADMFDDSNPSRKFRPAHIELWFHDEELWNVLVTGPAIRKNGSVGTATRYAFFFEFIRTSAGAHEHVLKEDTPPWVRRTIAEYAR